MEKYTASGDFGRTIGYRRAIANIRCYKKPITDVRQLDGIPHVGKSVKHYVSQMLAEDGSFDKLERLTEENPKLSTIEKLTGIWGLGPKLAESLYDKGIRSVDGLR